MWLSGPHRISDSEFGPRGYRIDALQYANWSETIFRQMREGGLDAVHVAIAYHETFRETVPNIEAWNRRFERYPDLIFQGFTAGAAQQARRGGRGGGRPPEILRPGAR